MVAVVWGGPVHRSLKRDEEGHRHYVVRNLVKTSSTFDGPATVLVATGLPTIGSFWNYGNDFDGAALCLPKRDVDYYGPNEKWPGYWWVVTSYFSTRMDTQRCQDETIEDPLEEPDRLSGSYLKFLRKVTKDRFGNLLQNSSHQPFTGPLLEFDDNRPTVSIEQNVADLELGLVSSMVDTVNDSVLWGLPPRTIKLCHASWTRELYGICSFYYKRRLEFDIKFDTYDRQILDEGTKVLNGHWSNGSWVLDNIKDPDAIPIDTVGVPPDPKNPMHYIYYKDKDGENSKVPLNGAGRPLDDTDALVYATLEYYQESNFYLLGVPSTLT